MAEPRKVILVVDDDPGQRSLLESFLSGQGFGIVTATSGEEALALLRSNKVDMMISDVRMPGMTGLEMLRRARDNRSALPVLLVTAYADIRDAVVAMRDGAVNYLAKPIDLDELLSSVQLALGMGQRIEAPRLEGVDIPDYVVARSRVFRDVLREAALVAPSNSRVLITGESGVGKEIVADLIHAWSPRARGPLMKINCASIPETLLESEMFGHEKGAFTDASSSRVGRFEEASEGTILLDEIAEMSPALQAKLLRVTHDGTFCRVGSNQQHRTNARILASTNRNLEKEVHEGRFREDLFFRLTVIELYVPSLRERLADIVPLANLFVAQLSDGQTRLSPSAMACLELYDWPGNVRELRNAIERATLMAPRGGVILPEHFPRRVQLAGPNADQETGAGMPGKRMEEVERAVIIQALREHGGNRTETARALGISRRALTYKIRHYTEQGYLVEPEIPCGQNTRP